MNHADIFYLLLYVHCIKIIHVFYCYWALTVKQNFISTCEQFALSNIGFFTLFIVKI